MIGLVLLAAFVIFVIVPLVSYIAGAVASDSSASHQTPDADAQRGKCQRDQDWWDGRSGWEKVAYSAWWLMHQLNCSKYFNVRW